MRKVEDVSTDSSAGFKGGVSDPAADTGLFEFIRPDGRTDEGEGMERICKDGFFETDEETVYVTETGVVYHRDYHCNYLELSIRMVTADSIDGLRNKEQGKYYPCEHCAEKGTQKGVYITDYGNRYHNSLNCSGLKRTIYAVPLSEASVGRGACTKCGR